VIAPAERVALFELDTAAIDAVEVLPVLVSFMRLAVLLLLLTALSVPIPLLLLLL